VAASEDPRTPGTAGRSPEEESAAPDARGLGLDSRLATGLAFVGGGCLLIIELVAARLLAPTLGVSLYTWTSVIGVVLAGVTLGNYLGGRIADRWPSRSTVALIYLAGSLTTLAILGLLHVVGSLQLSNGAPVILQVLWLNALLFFLPSTVIAAATPVLTRLSLHSVAEGGRVVGRIQAAAALGSITGTFLTGFVLVSAFGTRWIVAGVAATLLVLAVAARPPWLLGRVYELAALLAVIVAAGWVSHSGCLQESDYYCIKVQDVSLARISGQTLRRVPGTFRALYLDRLLDGIADLSDPTVLYYEYEQLYAEAIAAVFPHGSQISALFLGGGEYSFPRYIEAEYRGNVDVAEVDPAVTRVARRYLGLKPSPRLHIHNEDARRFVSDLPAQARYDLIFGDTFNDFAVPYQLTTKQFNDLLARHLQPNGLYLLNVIDGVHHDYLRSEIRTLRETFPYVGVLRITGSWPPPPQRATYVLVAAKHVPAHPLPAVVPPAELEAFVQHGHSVVLTDDYVPVDQLLAPVFARVLHSR
jgi:spermidine synthase